VSERRTRGSLGRDALIGASFGAIASVLLLLGALTWGGAGGDDVPAKGPREEPVSIADFIVGDDPVPDGDYAAFCRGVADAVVVFTGDDQLGALRAATTEIDVDALAAVAPGGLRPALETVGEERATVRQVLDQVDAVSELAPADFPAGFLSSFGLVVRAAAERCPGLLGGG